jgi:hypothetical protein
VVVEPADRRLNDPMQAKEAGRGAHSNRRGRSRPARCAG